jgi:hypothetical protein
MAVIRRLSIVPMALAGAGWLAEDQGDLDRAKEVCVEGLELLEHEAREASEAKLNLLACLGWVAWHRGELGRQQSCSKKAWL